MAPLQGMIFSKIIKSDSFSFDVFYHMSFFNFFIEVHVHA